MGSQLTRSLCFWLAYLLVFACNDNEFHSGSKKSADLQGAQTGDHKPDDTSDNDGDDKDDDNDQQPEPVTPDVVPQAQGTLEPPADATPPPILETPEPADSDPEPAAEPVLTPPPVENTVEEPVVLPTPPEDLVEEQPDPLPSELRASISGALVKLLSETGPSTVETDVAGGVDVAEEFKDLYVPNDLGLIPGVERQHLGGLTMADGDVDHIIVGAKSDLTIYKVPVKRNAKGEIVELLAGATVVADNLPCAIDGGLAYIDADTLIGIGYPCGKLFQIRAGEIKVTDLTDKGAPNWTSGGALGFVADWFDNAGAAKFVAWPSGLWMDADHALDSNADYDFTFASDTVHLEGGPEGFAYIPLNSPGFPKPSIVVTEWSVGNVVAYEADNLGNVIPDTRRLILSNVAGAVGSLIDPITGDFLFSSWGGGDNIIALRGFNAPEPVNAKLDAWKVYLDLNENGQLDADEPVQLTDANGLYSFADLSAGDYVVGLIYEGHWQMENAGADLVAVTAIAGATVNGVDFRVKPAE